MAKVWTDTGLDPIGVAAGFGASACLAAFLMIGKNALDTHHPLTLAFWMFAVAVAVTIVGIAQSKQPNLPRPSDSKRASCEPWWLWRLRPERGATARRRRR